MSKKTKVIDPFQQDRYEDTPWITRNRELNTKSYDLYNQAIDDLSKQDQQYYEGIVGKATQSMWDDYNRNYQKAVNQNLARNYGRTGSTGSTSGSYVTDNMQRQYNDMASRIASQGYGMYDNLVNSDLNRTYAKLGTYGNIFNTSGVYPERVDFYNYEKVDQANKQRQWQADATKKMNDPGQWGQIGQVGGQIVGTAIGSYFGGPVGGQIGGAVGGAAGGAIGGQFDTQYVMPGQQASQSNSSGSGGMNLSSLTSLFGKGSGNLGSNVGGSSGVSSGGSSNPYGFNIDSFNQLQNAKFSWQQ